MDSRDFADKARTWADFSMDGDQLLAELDAAAAERFSTPQSIGSGLEDDNDGVVFFAAKQGLKIGIMVDECRDALERLKRTRHMHLSAVIPEFLRELSKRTKPEAYPEVRFETKHEYANAGSKVGGDPDFIQPAEPNACRRCGRPMGFLAQIDSMPEKLDIVDNGMVYVFYCEHCFLASADVQFH